MSEQIENRMVVDSEWEEMELLQMRMTSRRNRRLQQVMDELEYGRLEESE